MLGLLGEGDLGGNGRTGSIPSALIAQPGRCTGADRLRETHLLCGGLHGAEREQECEGDRRSAAHAQDTSAKARPVDATAFHHREQIERMSDRGERPPLKPPEPRLKLCERAGLRRHRFHNLCQSQRHDVVMGAGFGTPRRRGREAIPGPARLSLPCGSPPRADDPYRAWKARRGRHGTMFRSRTPATSPSSVTNSTPANSHAERMADSCSFVSQAGPSLLSKAATSACDRPTVRLKSTRLHRSSFRAPRICRPISTSARHLGVTTSREIAIGRQAIDDDAAYRGGPADCQIGPPISPAIQCGQDFSSERYALLRPDAGGRAPLSFLPIGHRPRFYCHPATPSQPPMASRPIRRSNPHDQLPRVSGRGLLTLPVRS